MDNLYSSFYLYKKYEIIGDELIDLGITSIDADGTQEAVMKEECDPACGCPEPIYRWVQTEDTVCVGESADMKYSLVLSDSSVVTGECDETSAITSGEVSSQYSGSVVSAVINDCVSTISASTFYRCTSLTSCTIPDSVTSIDSSAFFNCSGLTSVNIPTGVTSIGKSAFRNCYNLSNVTIPNGITAISNSAFDSCRNFTTVTIPSGVTSIESYAFYMCTGLTSITCLATTPPTLTGRSWFYGVDDCPIYVPCESVSAYQAATNWSDYSSRIEGIPPCGSPKEKIVLFEGSESFGQYEMARFSKSVGFLQVAFEHDANGYLDYLYENNEPLYVEFSSVPGSGTLRLLNGWWSVVYDPALPVSTSEPLQIYITDYDDIYSHDLGLVDYESNGFTITSVYFYK